MREFQEEIGQLPPNGALTSLESIRPAGGKVVHAWALRADVDISRIKSATFNMEWPPRSGRMQEYPEVDRAEWFDLDEARRLILHSQLQLFDPPSAHE